MDWLIQSSLGSFVIALLIVVVVTVLSILIIRFVFRKLNISLTGGMPKSALWQAFKQMLILMGVIFGILGIVLFFFMYILHQSPQDSVVFSLGLYFLAGLIAFLVIWRKLMPYRGQLVYEIASEPINKNAFLFNTFILPLNILILFYALNQLHFSFNLSPFAWFVAIAEYILVATVNIMVSKSKLQIYERGVMTYIFLVEWNTIESYRWGEANEKIISLKIKNKGKQPALLREGVFMVPVNKKDEVDTMLRYYLDFLPNLTPEPEPAK